MKKGLAFLLGVAVGIILTIAVIKARSEISTASQSPISWYEEPYETISFRNGVEVFQMLEDEYGLSKPKNYQDGVDIYLVHGEKIYDGKHIGKNKFHVIGVYTYTSKDNRVRNVPVIEPVN